jgi:hypothetical protein
MFIGCHGDKPNNGIATVHIGNHVMQCVDTVKDLGVYVDDNIRSSNIRVRLQHLVAISCSCSKQKSIRTAHFHKAYKEYERPVIR